VTANSERAVVDRAFVFVVAIRVGHAGNALVGCLTAQLTRATVAEADAKSARALIRGGAEEAVVARAGHGGMTTNEVQTSVRSARIVVVAVGRGLAIAAQIQVLVAGLLGKARVSASDARAAAANVRRRAEQAVITEIGIVVGEYATGRGDAGVVRARIAVVACQRRAGLASA
jgi:hypothetical protein